MTEAKRIEQIKEALRLKPKMYSELMEFYVTVKLIINSKK